MYCFYKHQKYLSKLKNESKNELYKGKVLKYGNMIGGFTSINKFYIVELSKLLKSAGVDESHGLSHALTVTCHASNALEQYSEPIDDRIKKIVRLASLLHDVDDHKYFPDNHNYENAHKVLKIGLMSGDLSDTDVEIIISMVDLVSSSKNGDNIPEGTPDWMVYPRYSDRLEALGIIGLKRTLEYTLKKGQPLYLPETEKATDKDDLFERVASEERYKNYNGKSVSMMDHVYDKLLRLGSYPIRNKYFDDMCSQRIQPLIDVSLQFSKTGTISEEDINIIVESQPQFSSICEQQVHEFVKEM